MWILFVWLLDTLTGSSSAAEVAGGSGGRRMSEKMCDGTCDTCDETCWLVGTQEDCPNCGHPLDYDGPRALCLFCGYGTAEGIEN